MRFGTIGTNFISREFVTAGEKVKDFSLAVVYSRGLETARAFSDQFGGADCVTDLSELAARADVDAVYIASPNLFHKEQAEQMLRAGKHVLLEKPACPNRQDFADLCALARAQGVVLLEAMRPYLSEKRRSKMDKAMKIAWLAQIARLAMGEMGGDGGD